MKGAFPSSRKFHFQPATRQQWKYARERILWCFHEVVPFIYLFTLNCQFNSMNIYQPTQYFPSCLPLFLMFHFIWQYSEKIYWGPDVSQALFGIFPTHIIYFKFGWFYIWLNWDIFPYALCILVLIKCLLKRI